MKYLIYEKKENRIDLKESETYERGQIENPTKINMRNNQERRQENYIIDTDTELEHGLVHDNEELEKKINKNLTTVIAENKKDSEVLYEKINSDSADEAQR